MVDGFVNHRAYMVDFAYACQHTDESAAIRNASTVAVRHTMAMEKQGLNLCNAYMVAKGNLSVACHDHADTSFQPRALAALDQAAKILNVQYCPEFR